MELEFFPQLLYSFLFVLGAITGSYLLAWMWRVEKGLWKFAGRSYCEICRKKIAWYDNIPLLSYLLLGGKCRYCRHKIGWDSFFVELVTGLLFVFVGFYHEHLGIFSEWRYLRDLFFVIVLIVTFVYDAKYMQVLTGLTWTATAIGLAINYFALGYAPERLIIGMVVGGGLFGLQYIISKGAWVGGGDVRLGVMMGAWLGWPLILLALFLSYIVGSVVSVPLLIWGKKKMKSEIPFGTFLALGTLIAIFYGEALLKWYLSFIT